MNLKQTIFVSVLLAARFSSGATYYVDASRLDDSDLGTSWSTAKSTIQAAVDLAIDGDTVLVTNGIYSTSARITPGFSTSNRVVITNAITVRSVNGSDATIIEGSGTNSYGKASAVRCVYMSKGVLDGFTLRNGTTLAYPTAGSTFDHRGAGINMEGSAAGTEVRNSIFVNCLASSGAGVSGGVASNCIIRGNSVDRHGGAASESVLLNCIVTNNYAKMGGGGYYRCIASNCLINNNSSDSSGGASYYSTFYNCTITENKSPYGGAYNDTLFNCILWGNLKTDGSVKNYDSSTFSYSCTTPLPAGVGNISSDPDLVDMINLHLRNTSPCIDAGSNDYITLSSDLDGHSRIQNGRVDMGAYEGGFVAVSRPVITPLSGTTFTNPATISISCATEETTLYYTLDGSEPTESSTLYTAPFYLGEAFTTNGLISVRARAYKIGMLSAQETATYTFYVAPPVFEPPTGTVSTNSLVFSLSCITSNAAIRYTTNGTSPTASSTLYTLPVMVTQSATIKAKAFKYGMADSIMATAAYTIIQTVATPTISPASGSVATNSLIFTLACTTPGASIRYTIDGSEPTSSSSLYSSPRTLTQSSTVKVKAFKSGMIESATAQASYTVLQTVATPTILPADGTTFTLLIKISMSCSTSGTEIRFTTDGSEPTPQSPLYGGAFNISQTTTFKAKAFKDGWAESASITSTYYKLPSLAEALNATNLTVTTGGSKVWFSQTNMTHDGVYAARSGLLTDNQSSWMETQVRGPGRVSFWWRTSCEDDPDIDNWDYVRFLVDGVEKARIDGITDWRQITYVLAAGEHILRWEYLKDYSLATGEDCAWVDQLSFSLEFPAVTTTTPVPVPLSWLDQYPTILQLAGGDYEVAALIDFDLDGRLGWEEYVAGTDPANQSSAFQAGIEMINMAPQIIWTPDLRPDRVYTVLGKTNLTDTTWGSTNAASRFFKVKVEMP